MHERDGKRQLHPIIFFVERAVRTHELRLFLPEAHGEKISHLRLFQVFAAFGRQAFRECFGERLVDGKKPLALRKPHGAGDKALGCGVHVAPHFLVPRRMDEFFPPLRDFEPQNAREPRNFVEIFDIHNISPLCSILSQSGGVCQVQLCLVCDLNRTDIRKEKTIAAVTPALAAASEPVSA